ncbi:MAG: tRNA (uridine(54)-C5)-methyltransferase TrmA [Helicobacteraceae bacterium]|jgi:tRNA (uracil-5-)-methyltransferase|nr:tRNA (uridine(54)-C5)-methyltransferase TrmA [Helicobacteraceae bacterium]
MNCKWFGECGGCALPLEYDEQLSRKTAAFFAAFEGLKMPETKVVPSRKRHFRNRGEFRVWHEKDGGIALSMYRINGGGAISVDRCPAMNDRFSANMQAMIDFIGDYPALFERLFELDFLASDDGSQMIITLIYHKPIDERWSEAARGFCDRFSVSAIGRSKGKKLVIGEEFIAETIPVADRAWNYRYIEGAFSQPNGYINRAMINHIFDLLEPSDKDYLELYCGIGNFTLPLSEKFRGAMAIEVNTAALNAAKINAANNDRDNIFFARMSAEEFANAMGKTRSFNRLKAVDLDGYSFHTALVDPPRAGLDRASLNLVSQAERVIYVSCNQATLRRDLDELTKTRRVVSAALFDQFPYAPHIESCVILERQ